MEKPQSNGEIAASYFHEAPYNFNCAQAVMAVYKGVDDPIIPEMKACGGGRAEGNKPGEGVCGAAYAAKLLRPDLEDQIYSRFKEVGKGLACKELKHRENPYPCKDCVRLACTVLDGQ